VGQQLICHSSHKLKYLTYSADQIRRTLSLANLDSLLLLSANPKGEREKLLAEVSKAGRELVWRDKNEKRLFPRDTERALVLAFKRGLRMLLVYLPNTALIAVQDHSSYHSPSDQESISFSSYSGLSAANHDLSSGSISSSALYLGQSPSGLGL
jgi:hypothetical protein